MTFWEFIDRQIDRMPGWPSERQWVTIWLGSLIVLLLMMASRNPKLWDVEVFKVIAQAVVLTGFLNMVLAFHFAANKGDEAKAINTGKMADAMKAVAENSGAPTTTTDAPAAAERVVDGARAAADEVIDESRP